MSKSYTASVQILIRTPATEVWQALTDPEKIRKYFFGTHAESDWKPGSSLYFRGEWQGKKYEDKGTILEIISGSRLRYNFISSLSGIEDKPENYQVITYDLEEELGTTRLSIVQENIPDEATRTHSEQNWMSILVELKKMLEAGEL